MLHPQRVAAVAGLSVPPTPRPRIPPTEAFRRTFGDNFFYMLYFQQSGVADADLAADPGRTMRRMLGGLRATTDEAAALRMVAPGPEGFIDRLAEPGRLPDWLSESEFDHYVTEFTRTGFTGGLNWYRNLDRNWAIMADPPATTITVPALFVAGADDPVLAFTRTDRAREVVSGPYRQVLIDGAGHWLTQERPAEVNAAVLDLLTGAQWS